MNFFYIDKLIWLMIMILGDIFYIHIIDGLFLAFWIPFFSFLVGFQAKELIFVCFDLVLGKKTQIMYFRYRGGSAPLDFFSQKSSSVWKFHYSINGKNYKKNIIIPIALTEEEIQKMEQPKTHEKIKVTYYPLSKIICSWERV